MNKFIKFALGFLLLAQIPAYSADFLSLPYTFQPRQLISASKIMANYNALRNGIIDGTKKINVAQVFINNSLVIDNDLDMTGKDLTLTGNLSQERQILISRSSNNLLTAIATATANSTVEYVLIIDRDAAAASACSLPSNIHIVKFLPDCEIDISGSGDVTFTGQYIDASPSQNIFDYDSTGVITGNITNNNIYANWFGAIADDGTSDSTTIKYAADYVANQGEGILTFNKGEYTIDSKVLIEIPTGNANQTFHMRGIGYEYNSGNTGTTFSSSSNSDKIFFELKNVFNGTFEGFCIDYDGTVDNSSNIVYGFKEDNTSSLNIRVGRNRFSNIGFKDITYGIRTDQYDDASVYEKLKFENVYRCLYLKKLDGGTVRDIVAETFTDYAIYLQQGGGKTIQNCLLNGPRGSLSSNYGIAIIIIGTTGTGTNGGQGTVIQGIHSEGVNSLAYISAPNVSIDGWTFSADSGDARTDSFFKFFRAGGIHPENCTIKNFVNCSETVTESAGVYDIFTYTDGTTVDFVEDSLTAAFPKVNGLRVIGWTPSHNIPIDTIPAGYTDYIRWTEEYDGRIVKHNNRLATVTHNVSSVAAFDTLMEQTLNREIPFGSEVIVQWATGNYTYSGITNVQRFTGGGTLTIQGNRSETDADALHTTQQTTFRGESRIPFMVIANNDIKVNLYNLEVSSNYVDTSSYEAPIEIDNVKEFNVRYNYFGRVTSGNAAIRVSNSTGRIQECYVGSTDEGIKARENAIVLVNDCDNEASNTPNYGIQSFSSIVMIDGTSPSGNVADENTDFGGVIR